MKNYIFTPAHKLVREMMSDFNQQSVLDVNVHGQIENGERTQLYTFAKLGKSADKSHSINIYAQKQRVSKNYGFDTPCAYVVNVEFGELFNNRKTLAFICPASAAGLDAALEYIRSFVERDYELEKQGICIKGYSDYINPNIKNVFPAN